MYLRQHRLYASGLGLYVYAHPRGEPPSERGFTERRLAQLQVGSPQVYYDLSLGLEEPALGPVLGRAVFPIDATSGVLSVCDGYAELDWASDDYAHVHTTVPPAEYDVVLTAHPARAAGSDWALYFKLEPQSRLWRDPRREQVIDLPFIAV